ncbi:MAG: hypothetical protein N2323_00330 [candidate division WOR-3 bacterium]|nr:hypothetical protein [candidate division WOR-3 bacterium]MDW8113502.1 hypothetical protein [candidate division WOR-3 bacterium]
MIRKFIFIIPLILGIVFLLMAGRLEQIKEVFNTGILLCLSCMGLG